MTLQECYAAMNGDYNDAIGRLRSDRLLQKFVLKFADDGSYSLLLSSLADENYQEAFRAAHTIKGVCQNLSLTALANSSSALCESLRGGTSPDPGLAEQVSADYQKTISAIRAFQEGIPG